MLSMRSESASCAHAAVQQQARAKQTITFFITLLIGVVSLLQSYDQMALGRKFYAYIVLREVLFSLIISPAETEKQLSLQHETAS
jgi:hypothetical protein